MRVFLQLLSETFMILEINQADTKNLNVKYSLFL